MSIYEKKHKYFSTLYSIHYSDNPKKLTQRGLFGWKSHFKIDLYSSLHRINHIYVFEHGYVE